MTPAELQQVVDMLNKLFNNMRENDYLEAAEEIETARDNLVNDYYEKRKRNG